MENILISEGNLQDCGKFILILKTVGSNGSNKKWKTVKMIFPSNKDSLCLLHSKLF